MRYSESEIFKVSAKTIEGRRFDKGIIKTIPSPVGDKKIHYKH